MRDFWEVAPKQSRGNSLRGALGLACPTCGVKLRVLQGGAQLSYVLVFGVPLALLFLVGRAIPLNSGTPSAKIALLCLGAIYVGGFILQQHYFPRLLQLRYLRDGEIVDYPLARAAKEQAAEDKFFEEQRAMESPDVGKPRCDLASYPHTSGVYNLMMSGGEYGSQKGRGTEPSVHERVQDRSGKTGPQRWNVGSESQAWDTGFEFIQLGQA